MTKRQKKFLNQMHLWAVLHNYFQTLFGNRSIMPLCENCKDWDKCGYMVEREKYEKERKSIPFSIKSEESKEFKLGHKNPILLRFHGCPEVFKKLKK